jgi:hypothetical protein
MPVITEVTLLTDVKAIDTSIDTKIGEVQALPTANTVLERLKQIQANTLGGGTTPTNILQQYVRPSYFEVSTEITRSANTTPYVINQIIGGAGITIMGQLDFSYLGGDVSGRAIQINNVSLFSSNGVTALRLNPVIHLATTSTFAGQTQTDTTAFNPTYAETIVKNGVSFESLYSTVGHGTGVYKISEPEILRNCKIGASSSLWVAIIANNAYVPANAEKITVVVKGYLL